MISPQLEIRTVGIKGAGSTHLAELLAQVLHSIGLAANPKEGALTVRVLLEHLTACVDSPAQLLCRPGQKKLGLNQILLEKRDNCLAELRDVVRATCTHHDAIRVPYL